jgi:hypothetical protein
MPFAMTITNGHQLDVDLTPGMGVYEWAGLKDDILQELTEVDRVMFLLPWGFEEGDQAHALDHLVAGLTALGTDVKHRHVDGPS